MADLGEKYAIPLQIAERAGLTSLDLSNAIMEAIVDPFRGNARQVYYKHMGREPHNNAEVIDHIYGTGDSADPGCVECQRKVKRNVANNVRRYKL